MGTKKSSKFYQNFSFVRFGDGTKKYITEDGEEETVFTDGTVQRVSKDKMKVITYASGQVVRIKLFIFNNQKIRTQYIQMG